MRALQAAGDVLGWCVFVVACLFALHAASNPIAAGDVFWQIKTGELIVQHRAVPWHDDFAWTTHGKPWIEHEWLLDVLDYGVYRLGGLGGIRVFYTAVWAWLVLRVFFAVRRVSGVASALSFPAPAALAVALLLCVCARQFIPAPSTVSLWMFLEIVLLLRPWAGDVSLRRGVLATAMFYVWVNMHAVAMLLPGLLGLYAGFPALQAFALAPAGTSRIAGTVKALRTAADRWLLLAACVVASFVTPYTWHIHAYALQGPDIARLVDEWASLFENDYVLAPTKIVFTLVALTWVVDLVLTLRRDGARVWLASVRSLYDVVAFLALVLALRHARFVWLGEIPLLVTLCVHGPALQRRVPSFVWAVVVAAVVTAAVRPSGWTPALLRQMTVASYYTHHLREGTLPVGAAQYLRAHPTPGRMYNHYIWGGYLLFELYPAYRVFIDGRTVLHGAELVEDAVEMDHGGPRTAALLEQYGVHVLVVGAHYVPDDVALRLGWHLHYRDAVSAVYTR